MKAGATLDEQLAAARAGDRVALARLLSVAENDPARAHALATLTWTGPGGLSVGITGSPGAGKSTLTDRVVSAVLADGIAAQVGVLCVDPTSPFSGGAILGDRVRMQDHALDERVFIRSVATRGHLGGLSIAVPDLLAVMRAASFDLVIVETVGVGQVELEVATTADMTIVVLTPGWGDAMQAAKAGLLEVADLFVVNKADRPGADETIRDLSQMLDLGTGRDDRWRPPIVSTVATDGTGIDELVAEVERFAAHLSGAPGAQRRQSRAEALLRTLLARRAAWSVDELVATERFDGAVAQVASGELDPYSAIDSLVAP